MATTPRPTDAQKDYEHRLKHRIEFLNRVYLLFRFVLFLGYVLFVVIQLLCVGKQLN